MQQGPPGAGSGDSPFTIALAMHLLFQRVPLARYLLFQWVPTSCHACLYTILLCVTMPFRILLCASLHLHTLKMGLSIRALALVLGIGPVHALLSRALEVEWWLRGCIPTRQSRSSITATSPRAIISSASAITSARPSSNPHLCDFGRSNGFLYLVAFGLSRHRAWVVGQRPRG